MIGSVLKSDVLEKYLIPLEPILGKSLLPMHVHVYDYLPVMSLSINSSHFNTLYLSMLHWF